jgi:hypothetical protein
MKTKLLVPAVVALTLFLSASSSMAATRDYLLGDPAPAAAAANRTIKITPDTTHVNVEGGQIVRFDIDGKTFSWDFNGPETAGSFDLNRVAPPGLLDHPVKVYVSPTPTYVG